MILPRCHWLIRGNAKQEKPVTTVKAVILRMRPILQDSRCSQRRGMRMVVSAPRSGTGQNPAVVRLHVLGKKLANRLQTGLFCGSAASSQTVIRGSMAATVASQHGVFILLGAIEGSTAKALHPALKIFANKAVLQNSSWKLGLSSIKQGAGDNITLQMLCKLQSVNLKEWHAQVARIVGGNLSVATTPKMSAALHALVVHMIKEGKRGVVHVISTGFQPGCKVLQRVVQQASGAHIHVCFTAVSEPLDSTLDEAERFRTLTAFENELAAFENVHMDQVSPDAQVLDHMVARWWLQLNQLASTILPAPGDPGEGRASSCITHLTLQLPSTSAPADTAPQSMTCSVSAQFQRWDPTTTVLGPSGSVSPAMTLQAGRGASRALASVNPQPSPSGLGTADVYHSLQSADVVLCVERAIKASELDQSLVHGMPFILQPVPCSSDQQPNDQARVFCALCKVLEERCSLLVASCRAEVQDSGSALPSALKHLYCLTPCSSPPALLLRRLACWEQLVPLTAALTGEAGVPDDQALGAAVSLVDQLEGRQGLEGPGGSAACLSSGCHADIARLVCGSGTGAGCA